MNRSTLWGGGAVTVAAATALWTGFAALPGGAYSKTQETGTASSNEKVAATASSPMAATEAVRAAASMQTAFNQVAQSAGPSVVTITTMERIPTPRNMGGIPFSFNGPGGQSGENGGMDDLLRQFFGQRGGTVGPQSDQDDSSDGPGSGAGQVRAGLGSGFIIRQDGLILTNAHVVHGADTVTVKIGDRTFKNAKVLGVDDQSDIAVVKVPAENLPTVTLGDSDQVNVGDWAIAVGNPFGLDHTLTVGVISAKGREVDEETGRGTYLQTDASINPGNSGGPLLDIYGRVIGINNSIYSRSGGSVGIGFAVPINTAKHIADILVKEGRVRRARLGVGIQDISPENAAAFGLDSNTKGVLVESVEPDSPAARAGLQPGDVVTALNGKGVSKSSDLQNQVSSAAIGSNISLLVQHAGTSRSLTATVEEAKDANAVASNSGSAARRDAQQPSALGVAVEPLNADIASQLGLDPATHGVVVGRVQSGSLAEQAGLRPGDVIERVGQTSISTPEQLKSAVNGILSKEAADSKAVALYINRRGQEQFVIVGQPQ